MKKMSKLFLLISLITLSLGLQTIHCFAQSIWNQKADCVTGGVAIANFSIGNNGYMLQYPKAFWEWNKSSNTWSRKSDFPGTPRGGTTGFSIGTKGYIFGGQEYGGFFIDLWEWDQPTNTWTQRANKGGVGRESASAFSIGNKGYIVGGYDGLSNTISELWEWDQSTNSWVQRATCPSGEKYGAVAFSIGNKGYFGTGGPGAAKKDFWEWDQSTDTWNQKADFGGGERSSAIGFSIGIKGYIGTGVGQYPTQYQDFWEWDQSANSWTQKSNVPGLVRYKAIGFAITDKGYVGAGTYYDTVTSLGHGQKDLWEFDPNCVSPPIPTATNIIICANNTASLSATGTGTLSWYNQAIGGTYLGGGANFTTPILTTTTTYYVQDSTCAASATRKTVVVTVNPLPSITASASATHVCAGASAILTGGGANLYTWSGGVTNGVGFVPTATTTYTVTGTGTDGNNCSNTATKTIHVNPLPTVTANASSTIVCAATSITLTGGGASSYTWSGGVTNGLNFVPSTTSTYTVTGTDGNNCANTATKTIHVNPLPIVTAIASATNVCEGTIVTLTGGGAASYTWSDGITNGVAFVKSTTSTYTVTGTDGNNCSNTATKTINVTPQLDLTTSLSGLTISANQTGAIYQWLNCNNGNSVIADATSQSYTASINGNYAVIVKMNSCSDTSTCVNVSITGIEKITENNIQLNVFPNPGNGSITIQSANEGIYTIKNESGQMIQTFKLNTSNNYTINIENLSNGIYFIVGLNGNQMINQKVVIAK